MKKYNIIITLLSIVAFFESAYLFLESAPRKGLDLIFALPLVFGLCLLYFGKKILPYHENGFGLKIYYSIAIVRYIIQPFLILISRGHLGVRMPEAQKDSYPVAVLIYCIEIVIACLAISKYYPAFTKKYESSKGLKRQIPLNYVGKSVILIYILFLVVRLPSWYPGMKILGLKEATSDIAVVFDATIFNCVKVFIFIYFLVKSKMNVRIPAKFRFYFSLAVIAGLFNFLTYFGSNRSFIYETAIATILIMIYAYPQYRKRVLVLSIPFAIIIMFVSFVTKQFAVENMVTVTAVNTETAVSNIIEEYANGLWTVARSYQSSIGLSSTESAEALLGDISDGLQGLSDLPGFKALNESLSTLRSSSEIFKNSLGQPDDRGQMLSLSGGFLIVGGEMFGWAVLLIGNYLMIMLLVYMEVLSKATGDLYYKYMYLWMSVLMGLVHCYCLQTIIYCWSKFILFYWLVLFINRKFNQKKKVSVVINQVHGI